jgi:cobalt/nickel transport system ATP-binding protein
MVEPVFSLSNVDYSYPGNIPALQGVSLSVQKGDSIAIIGANGTGKSTLLTMLDALIFPTRGGIRAFGRELTEKALNDAALQRMFRKKVGFVFQNPDIQLFCPTVREDVLFGPLQLDVPKEEITRRFDSAVDCLRIGPLLDRSPHQLSIGEKKKAAIASMLVIEPEVLLLDEPTAGLDPQTNRDIIAVLNDVHKSGRTIVIATHDLHIVEEIADIIHVFGASRSIIRSGKPEEVLSDDDFLRKNNLVHVHVHRHLHIHHSHPH